MKVSDIPGIYNLSTAEKIQLVEDLWDTIAGDVAGDAADFPVTAEQKAELDRRLAAFAADGDSGKPAGEVIDDIRRGL